MATLSNRSRPAVPGTALRLLAASGLLALAACNDAAFDLAAGARGTGATVSVEALEGAPDALRQQVASALVGAAESRRVTLVSGGDAPRYRVKGYLTAYRTADGATALAYVWDVFDAGKQRTQRVAGEAAGRGVGTADPWTAMDDTVLRRMAAQSMDGIASAVSGATAQAAVQAPAPEVGTSQTTSNTPASSPLLGYSAVD